MTAYYVNVAEWSPEQVADWMRGLDDTLLPYIHLMLKQGINGHRLLSTTVEDLPVFYIDKLGHQEIFMGAIDLLRDFHYNLDRENLQYLAMQLGCKARSLFNELRSSYFTFREKTEQVTTATLAAVADIIDRVKDLLSWLDRSPFDGHEPYLEVKSSLLKICLELATNAQRDLFAEHPVQVIRDGCISLVGITDRIICEFLDPLVLQPASLDVATVKKKPEEDVAIINSHSISNSSFDGIDLWLQGMLIQTSYKGVHVIGGVKFQSPAHQCGKIEEGDEVVQVNYQTVVGWQQKKLKAAMLENPTKVILTLKKRPRHSNNFGQIYVKPYRLPSKKRESYPFRWHLGDGQTKPEITSSTKAIDSMIVNSVPTVHVAPPVMAEVLATELPSEVESDDTDDDSFLPDGHDPVTAAAAAAAVAAATGLDSMGVATASPASVRLILPKNRLSIQRRATVTGASPTSSRPALNIEQFWKELKEGQKRQAPEMMDLLLQQQQQAEQRPHSSVGHYEGQPRRAHHKEANGSSDSSDKTNLLLLLDKDKVNMTSPTKSQIGVKPNEKSEGIDEFSDDSKLNEDEVEIRSPSRKVSQDRPRLDKSQSTPTYEIVVGDTSSFEEKLREIRLRKQSRVEEEVLNPIAEDPNTSPSLTLPPSNAPPLSPKPALPPRNKVRTTPEEEPTGEPSSSPTSATTMPYKGTVDSPLLNSMNTSAYSPTTDNGYSHETSPGMSTILSNSSAHELSHLGLRPHEIRDLIRRGLWPRHPTDEDRALPALTRVTRLDSNFDPVPGSTVPRIAPSLLVTYAPTAHHDEEVHVTLPPVKSNRNIHGNDNSHYGVISPIGGRNQYQHSQRPAQQTQQQQHHHFQQQSDHERSSVTADGQRHRRVPCRELGEGDCQGWLYRRRQTRGFFAGPRWTRRFFVLKRHTLYGYRDPEDQKAESLICLPGFSSSVATEVKSKKFAFRIFNPGTMFYFACETKEDLTKWLNTVKQSATASFGNTEGSHAHKDSSSVTKGAYYSETEDESLDESENQKGGFSATLGRRKGKVPPALPQSNSHKLSSPFGGTATLGRIRKSRENPYSPEEKSPVSSTSKNNNNRSPMAASLDRKYLRFLRVAPEKQPVPTPQFRSYRKPSPSPSPTATSAPVALPPSPYWTDGSKPPPRPPNESKPASPFNPHPSSPFSKEAVESSHSTFDFSSPIQMKPPNPASRHSAERAAPRTNHSDAINAFRKSISTSKLPSSHNQSIPLEVMPEVTSNDLRPEKDTSLPAAKSATSPRRPQSNRRHSIEIIDSKSPKSATKPQLAPKPSSLRVIGKVGSESSTGTIATTADGIQRRAMYGSLNRSGTVETDVYGSLETGYAKIKPRNTSSAGDYFRSNSIGSSATLSSPNRSELAGQRRSSVSSSSRRSSADGGTGKANGASSSLSRLPSPNASLSPTSPSRGVFDFAVDSPGQSYRQGPPDQLWINSLRSGTSSSPSKHGYSPDRPKNSNARLKSAACYQPMNFPLSPKDDAKMRAAFEMNLDVTSTPTEPETHKSGAAAEAKQFFKMLVSPKFGRKTSPSLPVKSKAIELLSPPSTTPTTPSPRLQKTLLGSPRLHRAIFGTSRDKRKKLSSDSGESNAAQTPTAAAYHLTEEPSVTDDRTTEGDDSLSSFNSSVSSEFSPRFSPASVIHHRSLQRPPPLISPLQSPSVQSTNSGSGVVVVSLYDDSINGSCPGTPKTPLPKPAMGVSMIGKQRRTPLGPESPFGPPPLSPPMSAGGSLRHSSSSSSHFQYSLTPKEGSPAPAAQPIVVSSPMHTTTTSGDLEYPPVFEPGTYSLSERNVEMHMTSTRTSLSSSSTLPPVPAPRTKFLSTTSSRLSHTSSIDSTTGSIYGQQQQRVHVRLETGRSIDESSNA